MGHEGGRLWSPSVFCSEMRTAVSLLFVLSPMPKRKNKIDVLAGWREKHPQKLSFLLLPIINELSREEAATD